jgi:hypothetical protein
MWQYVRRSLVECNDETFDAAYTRLKGATYGTSARMSDLLYVKAVLRAIAVTNATLS